MNLQRHKLILVLGVILFFLPVTGVAEYTDNYEFEPAAAQTEPEIEKGGICSNPKVNIKGELSECLLCHTTPSFKVKEPRPDEGRQYPTSVDMKVKGDTGYYFLTNISPWEIELFLEYLELHNIKKAVINIHSPGGSLFDAWRVVSMFAEFTGTVETRVRGFAASAGCMVFLAGDKGHRKVSRTAMLMWHELLTFKFLAVASPSSTEDEAKILRKIQDTTNDWLAERTGMTKEEIDKKVRYKEFWMNGKEAVELGFADGFIGR